MVEKVARFAPPRVGEKEGEREGGRSKDGKDKRGGGGDGGGEEEKDREAGRGLNGCEREREREREWRTPSRAERNACGVTAIEPWPSAITYRYLALRKDEEAFVGAPSRGIQHWIGPGKSEMRGGLRVDRERERERESAFSLRIGNRAARMPPQIVC